MKRFLLIAATLIALVSCSKNDAMVLRGPVDKADTFFSRMKFYSDDRGPQVDTMMTLKLINKEMVDEFMKYDGYFYEQASTYFVIGKVWTKPL